MFTGIIKEVGQVEKIVKQRGTTQLVIRSNDLWSNCEVSDSVSINGVCLTVVKKQKCLLFFDAIDSTLKKTNLKKIRTSGYVNLELALRVGDKLGGHFVLGHVDGEAKLIKKIKIKNFWRLDIELLSKDRNFILENGSIALEGISLTVKRILAKYFSVELIPFTYEHTNLKYKKIGETLNIEFDQLLKVRGSV
ncbi:MAG: riboflavin synthase [Candidatus Omnitrophota bacterium]|nr:riboflavin synthase [Candidatus Omnitrophota bacterium]